MPRELHEHLLNIRNKLIGHDDHDVIEPKVMTGLISPQDEEGRPNGYIPMVIEATNKCMAHPASLEKVGEMFAHTTAVLMAVHKAFMVTADESRQRTLDYPAEALEEAEFSQRLDSFITHAGSGKSIQHPNLREIPWFNITDPFEGYTYITYNLRAEFNNQTVTLPNGEVIYIRPTVS